MATIALMLCCSLAVGAQIRWHVESPFRLFPDPADTHLHRAALESLTLDERLQPILSSERRLSATHPRGWSENVYQKLCWSKYQHYACPEFSDYAHPTSHRVVASLTDNEDQNAVCRWTTAELNAPKATARAIASVACHEAVALEVPFPAGVRATVSRDGQVIATADIRVRDVFIVGIGDSYAGGDGNPDEPIRFDDRRSLAYSGPAPDNLMGYPVRVGAWTSVSDSVFAKHAAGWLSAGCHRSLYGHQMRAALQLALEDPHRAVTFATFACWGTDIVNGIFLPSTPTDLVPDLPTTSQLSDVARLQCGRHASESKDWPRAFEMSGALPDLAGFVGRRCPAAFARRIDLLLATVGGNDIGFSRLVANAVLADATPLRKIGGWLGQVITAREASNALPALEPRFKALNRAAHLILHIPWDETDRIVLTAYPPMAMQETTGEPCPSGRQGMTVIPDFVLDQRRTRDSEMVGAELHRVMRELAKDLGWTFVDAHRREFARHGICAGAHGSLVDPADDVRLPKLVDGVWRPYPPSQWQPYASRRRWIRTPNDGYLTVNFHFGKAADAALNLLLASSYSGAFHPTAEGQAAIADALADKARGVLDRYGSPRVR